MKAKTNVRYQVRKTMYAIRGALRERWYTWENARVEGMEDEEVDLYADLEKGERAYLPRQASEDVQLGSEDDQRTDPSTLPQPEATRPDARA